MIRELWGRASAQVCALSFFILSIAAVHGQGIVGQRIKIDNVAGNTGTYTAQLPAGTPAGTVITWTVFGNTTISLGTTLSNASAQASYSTFVLGSSVSGLVTACLPAATSTADPVNCALMRYIGIAIKATKNSPSGFTGQIVSPNPAFTFLDSVNMNGVIDEEPRSGVTINWSVLNGGGTLGSTTSVSNASGVANVQYTAGPATPLQQLRAAFSGPVFVTGGNTQTIDVTVQAATNAAPTVNIATPAANLSVNVGTNLPILVRATDDVLVARVEVTARPAGTSTITWTDFKTAPNSGTDGYTFTWPNLPVGTYSLTAIARDNVGAQTLSAERVITVVSAPPVNSPPTISIDAPAADTTAAAGGTLTLRTRASDADGRITSVAATAINTASNAVAWTDTKTNVTSGTNGYDFSWPNVPVGIYSISVTATDNDGAKKTAPAITLRVKRVVSAIKVETPVNQRVLKAGVPFTVNIVATDANGGVANEIVDWKVVTLNSGAKRDRKAGECAADTPNAGSTSTGNDGKATFSFTPGCSPQDRVVELTLRSDPAVNSKDTILRGPISQVKVIEVPTLASKAIVALPGQPISVTVKATDNAKAAVADVPLTWTLLPDATVGSVQVVAPATNAQGEAEAKITLAKGTKQVLLQVCVTGQTQNCPTFVLKNAEAFVQQPAQSTLAATTTSAITTTRLQLSQLRTRFQQLRNEQSSGFSSNVGVAVDGNRIPVPGGGTGSSSSSEGAASGSASSSSASGGGSTERDVNADGVKGSRWGVFTLGDIDVSTLADGQGGRTKLSTQGLTVGVDYRFRPSIVIGAALGGLRGKATSFGGAEQRARGASGSLFMQWFAPGQFYANTIVNYGRNSYDLKRFASDAARIDSNTDSKQRAFQLEGGYNYSRDNLSISPYLRYEHVRAAIGGINESGHPDAIMTTASKLRANTFALGLQADAKFSTGSGVWIPGIRVEYLKEKQTQSDAFAQLVNGTPLVVPVPVDPYDTSYGNVGVSVQWLTGLGAQPISVFFGFDTTFGKSGVSTKRYTAGVKVPL
jgi:uncharacterized protein YhjY with autotransporter beta-barrel domain